MNRDRADTCPTGYYCPETTGADLMPCPAGTYNPITGIHNITQCTQCDGGSYCNVPALSAVAGNCSDGFYCSWGMLLKKTKSNYSAILIIVFERESEDILMKW